MTEILLKQHDYHGAAALIMALDSPEVGALKTCFIHLSSEENNKLKEYIEIIRKDSAWKKMADCLQQKQTMIPHLGGIKHKLIRSKEARQIHAMEADFLQSSGKLKKSKKTLLPEKQSILPALKDSIKRSEKKYSDLNEFQTLLLPVDTSAEFPFKIATSGMDKEQLLQLANDIERTCIPTHLMTLKQQLYAALELFALDKAAHDKEALDKKIQVAKLLKENCGTQSKLSYTSQYEFVDTLMATEKRSTKSHHLFDGLFKRITKKDSSTVTQLSDILTILDKLIILETKLARLERNGSTSSFLIPSACFITPRNDMRVSTGSKNPLSDPISVQDFSSRSNRNSINVDEYPKNDHIQEKNLIRVNSTFRASKPTRDQAEALSHSKNKPLLFAAHRTHEMKKTPIRSRSEKHLSKFKEDARRPRRENSLRDMGESKLTDKDKSMSNTSPSKKT